MKKINKALLISSILSGVVAVALTVFYIIYKIQVSGAAYVELATKSILKAYDLLHTTSVIGWCCFGMWILTGILVIALVIIKAVTASKIKIRHSRCRFSRHNRCQFSRHNKCQFNRHNKCQFNRHRHSRTKYSKNFASQI